MWVGSDSRAEARVVFIHIFSGIQRQELIKYCCCLLTSVAALSTDNGQLRTETFAYLSAAGKESPGPLLTPVRLHTQVSSESRPPSHWSTHRPAPPKGRGPAVRVTAAMNPRGRAVAGGAYEAPRCAWCTCASLIDRMRHWSIVGSVGQLHGPGRQRSHASAGQPVRPEGEDQLGPTTSHLGPCRRRTFRRTRRTNQMCSTNSLRLRRRHHRLPPPLASMRTCASRDQQVRACVCREKEGGMGSGRAGQTDSDARRTRTRLKFRVSAGNIGRTLPQSRLN
jgi:hypothetical protein